jgi:acyl-CoA synthetase (NDP forming)
MAKEAPSLAHLLTPRSIALVGVSESSRWSRSIVDNLALQGFPGPVYMINPRHATQFGRPSYPSLREVPGEVDLAYVMVPTAAALEVAADCVAKGVRAVVMLTSGFAEVGPQGAALQQRLTALLAEHGVALCGPNCLGFVNANANVAAYALAMAEPARPGRTGVVLQSGALLLPLLRAFQKRELGLATLISSGNEAMFDATDFLAHMVEDPAVGVLGGLLEGIRRPAAFARVCDRALELGKPVVVLKLGRSEVGRRVAVAHTGALAGASRFADALFRRHGVVQVRTLEDFVETLGLLASYGPPPGERVAVVASSGGVCGIASDLGSDLGLTFPEFDAATIARLRGVLPAFASPQNPLDVTGYVVIQPDLATRATEAVMEDPGVDATLLVTYPPERSSGDAAADDRRMAALADLVRGRGRYVALTATQAADLTPYGRELARRHNLFFLGGVSAALRAVAASQDFVRARGRRREARPPRPLQLALPGAGPLDEVESKRLLAAAGIALPREGLADSAEQAAAVAREIGYPVVLKVVSPDLPHKTEAGVIALGVGDEAELRAAYDRIVRNAGGARVVGVLVAEEAHDGIELLAGVQVDPVFGPGVVVGLGGIYAEIWRDTALRLAPLDEADAWAMVRELRCYPILAGARGRAPYDLAALTRTLLALSDLAVALGPRLRAVDVNPLLLRIEGRGAVALDALVDLGPAEG